MLLLGGLRRDGNHEESELSEERWEDNIYLGYTFENTIVVTTNQESGDEFLDLHHPFLQNSKNVFKFRVVMATTFYTCKSCQIDR